MTRFISITSGKGGVGKTSFTANLGIALSRLGKDVIILDGNLDTPNLGIHLGIPETPTSIFDVLENKRRIEEIIYLHNSGVKIIPASLSMWNLSQKLDKDNLGREIINLMGRTDYILIDSSPGLDTETRMTLAASDENIIVTNPDLPSITDALKIIELSKRMGSVPLGFVLNKVSKNPWQLSPRNVHEFLGIPMLGTLPEDNSVPKSIRLRTPAVISYPYEPASINIQKIASKITGMPFKEPRIPIKYKIKKALGKDKDF